MEVMLYDNDKQCAVVLYTIEVALTNGIPFDSEVCRNAVCGAASQIQCIAKPNRLKLSGDV